METTFLIQKISFCKNNLSENLFMRKQFIQISAYAENNLSKNLLTQKTAYAKTCLCRK